MQEPSNHLPIGFFTINDTNETTIRIGQNSFFSIQRTDPFLTPVFDPRRKKETTDERRFPQIEWRGILGAFARGEDIKCIKREVM
jgi:hypothetical protein